jgi:hypothetical protein
MELVAIENTRVIYLTHVHRPTGQLYLPEAAARLAARYSFVKRPSLEEVISSPAYVAFGVGKFEESQIQELRVYGDGIIVESRSNSRTVDAFVDDLLDWQQKDLGLTNTVIAKPERYYESSLVVQSTKDIMSVMGLPPSIAASLDRRLSRSQYQARPMVPAGLILDCDSHLPGGRRKQDRFGIERRIGIPFEENVYLTMAPLPTDDHLALLSEIEGLA